MADFSDVVSEIKNTNKAIDKLTQATDPKGAAAAEDKRDAANAAARSENYLKAIANAVGGGGKGDGLDPKDKKKGGMLAGIGGALGGLGIGAGVALGGMGALFAGGGYLLKQIAEFDGKAVVANVKELLKITELFEGIGDAFSKSAIMAGTMGAIAAGLIAFSAGAAFAGAVAYFTKGTKWAEGIYDNVKTLVGIQDIKGYDTFNATGFAGTMFGIASGIVAFSIGGAVAGLAQALTRFLDSSNWAQVIHNNVETLVSIQNIKGYDTFNAIKFAATMIGIGAGLVAFAIGTALASMTQALTRFLDTTNWAQVIHDNVETLVSIQFIKGYDTFSAAGFAATMLGIGAGLVAFAIGTALASMTQALTRFMDVSDWTQVIHDNVKTLVSIQFIKGYDTFKAAGFAATMLGIGAGLVAFSIGEVAASTTQALAQFLDTSNWAQSLYDNVETLVSIQNIKGYDTFNATGFAGTMLGIALGLVAFSIGEGAKGLTQAMTKFLDVTNWAQSLYDNVKTLVSIQFIKGYDTFSAAGFAATMLGIALGLVAFSIGEGATGLAQSLTQFANVKPWTQSIYDNVATLISIMSIPNIGADTAKFLAVMTGLAAGLFVFAIGKGANVMGDALSKFTGNFADNIKKDVTTLISILGDPNVSVKKSEDFNTIMGNMALGLTKFAAGDFVGALAGAAKGVISFLTGDNSPVQEVMKLASKSEELEKGANAIGKIGDGLDKMAGLKFDGSKINITKFAEDLKESIPVIEAAIMGSEKVKWFGSNIKLRGLASTDIKWDEAATNMKILREALGVQAVTDMGGIGGSSSSQAIGGAGEALKSKTIETLQVNTIVAQTLINKALEKSAAGQGGNNFVDASTKNVDASQKTSNATYANYSLDNPNKVINNLNAM